MADKYDRLYAACVTPFKPGQEEVDEAALRIRYKAACWLRGLIPDPFMRPPVPKPMVEEVCQLRTLLRAVGYETISDAAIKHLYPETC